MRRIIIIGTLHAGLTTTNDLRKVLIKYNPTQLMVEISEKDIKKGKINKYPPEMIYAFKWATQRKIRIDGFDSSINTLRKGITNKDNLSAINTSKSLLKGRSWKDMNKEKNLKILEKITKKLTDPTKENKRNSELVKNIEKNIDSHGIIVILTGCGHLKHFEKHFRNAIFPFR